jgi:hypothetical protein
VRARSLWRFHAVADIDAEKILERQEKLEEIDKKSEDLLVQSKAFSTNSKTLKCAVRSCSLLLFKFRLCSSCLLPLSYPRGVLRIDLLQLIKKNIKLTICLIVVVIVCIFHTKLAKSNTAVAAHSVGGCTGHIFQCSQVAACRVHVCDASPARTADPSVSYLLLSK